MTQAGRMVWAGWLVWAGGVTWAGRVVWAVRMFGQVGWFGRCCNAVNNPKTDDFNNNQKKGQRDSTGNYTFPKQDAKFVKKKELLKMIS